MNATAFRQLADDEIAEVRRSGVLTPGRFVAGARHREFTDAYAEYVRAFPRDDYPERVDPWWVMTGATIRARIMLGRPYTKADEPVIGKGGVLLTEGTDGEGEE